MTNIPTVARFFAKVTEPGPSCWEWCGSIQGAGYGTFYADGRMVLAHRWAYEYFVGPIPVGLCLDHLCRVRHCVNPGHLEPVTLLENKRRGVTVNETKTHCPQGHPYTGTNLYRRPDGRRRCRACARDYRRARVAERGGPIESRGHDLGVRR